MLSEWFLICRIHKGTRIFQQCWSFNISIIVSGLVIIFIRILRFGTRMARIHSSELWRVRLRKTMHRQPVT